MKENEYQCVACQGIFEKGWSDEEAIAELKENFGDHDIDDCELVCDDCYKQMDAVHPFVDYKNMRDQINKYFENDHREIDGFLIKDFDSLWTYLEYKITEHIEKEAKELDKYFDQFVSINDIKLKGDEEWDGRGFREF